jgi:subtilisin family serine protease
VLKTKRVVATAIWAIALVPVLGGLSGCSTANSGEAPKTGNASPKAPESRTTRSYIVEARTASDAEQYVKLVGGHVVSPLGIINAVEANLTPQQHAMLKRTSGIRQITENGTVTTQAAAYVRDRFEASSFANNDGSHRWWGDWVEQNDDNAPWGGNVTIGWAESTGKHLIIGRNGTVYRRAATPSSSATVTLKLNYRRNSLESGEYVAVQASSNGGSTWTEVGRISGAGTDNAFVAKSYSLTSYKGRNTAIRFVGSMNEGYPNDYVKIDDVEITYTTTYGEGAPVPVDVNAARLHANGIRARDVGVAIVDTGYWKIDSLDKNSGGEGRVAAQYDAIRNVVDSSWSSVSTDTTGHGTHITSLIASSRRNSTGQYFGVAPDARIISIKAFNEDGTGTYASVIRAIDYVVTNKNLLAIRVLNLSLGAPARSRYWDDPLNKAVMRAWQSGIVVVVSAGNSGPLPQTVGVPGNVPYVITVGAMTDNYTTNKNDDRLASFSATGPTFEGFVKPDLVAPGGHLWGFMATYQKIAVDRPTYMNSGDFFQMSGTSQSAAVVSGVAALLIGQNPGLTPDQVKCRIVASGRPAVDSKGKLAYSVLQQGSGVVDAERALAGTVNNCANQGLNINADLAGTQHYMGGVRQQPDGTFTVSTPNGTLNEQGYLWSSGYLWSTGYLWSSGYLWSNGYLWSTGYLWPLGYDIPWVGGYPAEIGTSVSSTSSMSINFWVNQE